MFYYLSGVTLNIAVAIIAYRLVLYAALLLGYTIHFIYCIWGNLRIAASLTAGCG